jgi:putative inorganic carbon (hco3(-)) transporter
VTRFSLARLISSVIFYALLVIIILVAIPYGTVEPWWVALFAILIFALGILWIIEGYISGGWFVREHTLLLPLVALGIFALIQTWAWPMASAPSNPLVPDYWISSDPFATKFFALKLFALALTCALLLRYLTTTGRLQALVWVIIGVACASALFGIVRQTAQRSEMGFILPFLKRDYGYGQFINKNHFALLMEMGFGLALGMIIGGGTRRDRALLYLAPILPIWTALVLSNSRGGILSMLAQVMFGVLIFPSPTRSKMGEPSSLGAIWWRLKGSLLFRALLSACLLIAIAVGIIWIGGDDVVSRMESVREEVSVEGLEGTARVQRKEIWKSSLRLVKEHWIAGAGLGAYGVAINQYHQGSGQLVPREAHNDYLELLASGGVIGVALCAWFLVAFTKRARQVLRESHSFRRAACYGALIAIFGVAIHSFVDFGLHVTVNSVVLMALVAIATARVPAESDPAAANRL